MDLSVLIRAHRIAFTVLFFFGAAALLGIWLGGWADSLGVAPTIKNAFLFINALLLAGLAGLLVRAFNSKPTTDSKG